MELTSDGFDSMKSDNTAWLQLPARKKLKIYCPDHLSAWRKAFRGQHGVLIYPDKDDNVIESSYDLLVSDDEKDFEKDLYILYSNVFNNFNDEELAKLEKDFNIQKELHSGLVCMILYQRKE